MMWSFFTRDALKDFGYELGCEMEEFRPFSVWRFHEGKKRSSGELVTMFVFDASNFTEPQMMFDIAKSSLKRIKTLKHPCFLTYIDSLETDKQIYLVTEFVEPLELHLMFITKKKRKHFNISWGIYQIATAVSFLHKDCNLNHFNLSMNSVFVDKAGEWKLFGLEYVRPVSEMLPINKLPALNVYNPPEAESSDLEGNPQWSYDSWGFGCFIWEIFNGKLKKSSFLKSPGQIPQSLTSVYCELVCANPKSRPSFSTFIKKASKENGYLNNKFVDAMLFLREIHIKDSDEKIRFFNNLSSSVDTFSSDCCTYKILPELINAFEFSNAGSSILSPLFKIGKKLDPKVYQDKVVPCIVKMFSSKDRSTRVKLLQQIQEFIEYIQPSVVNSHIFPNIAQGFMDTNPTIRDHTIKCMIYLAPKLSYHNLNEEMLKYFARLQSKDEEGGIRTNTTVCLGKIASYLHPQTRKKVLISAFLRALRDPFPPARSAAILALSATENYYSINDCATKVLPALCHFTVDPEESIREQAFKAIRGFLSKLESVSKDPSLIEDMEKQLQSTTPSSIAASWTSWAVTSIADKLYKSTSKPPNSIAQSSVSTKEIVENIKKADISENVDPDLDSWEDAQWDIETSKGPENEGIQLSSAVSSTQQSETNDWEDNWDSFETKENVSENTQRLKNFFPDGNDDPFSSFQNSVDDKTSSDWNSSDNWDSWETSISNKDIPKESAQSKQELSRIREEKRKQRLKLRHLANSKKLGAQKISQP